MLKFIIVCFYVMIVGIISIPQYIHVNIVGMKDPVKKIELSQMYVRRYFKFLLATCNIKVVATGMENVPKDEAVLFVANHRGFFDIISTYATIPVRVGFVAKKEIKKVPSLGVWMKYLKCLFLDRKDKRASMKTILDAIENVKSGQSMFIMPEGTRSKTPDMLPFKKGSFKIADKANAKVVPVGIVNSDEVFEKHFPRITSGTIYVHYGKPIDLPNMTKEERGNVHIVAQQAVQEILDKIKADI
ncbi:MAG: 1-acyl-sn-glycerol-3-phosphate acyltransferase [Lachnospiraceae bacterium]|nr:1-acyl-sn-glycerol-3-phosphate acyltransferase [Lachnospiraceae bacterium]